MNHRIAYWLAGAALLLAVAGGSIAGDHAILSIREIHIDDLVARLEPAALAIAPYHLSAGAEYLALMGGGGVRSDPLIQAVSSEVPLVTVETPEIAHEGLS
jgi:hypothetical protein